MTVQFWILTGLVYVALLFPSGEWRRLVPTSWSIVPDAFHAAATYLNGHLAEPKPGHAYNALQQLAYFAVVFLLAPLQIATGAAMSPSIIARFPRYTRLFGGRQAARTLHFLGLCAFAAFVVVHTVMVLLHGLGECAVLSTLPLAQVHVDPARQARVEAAHGAHDVDALEVVRGVLLEDRGALHRVLVRPRRAVDVAGVGVPGRGRIGVVVRDLAVPDHHVVRQHAAHRLGEPAADASLGTSNCPRSWSGRPGPP